VKELYTVAEVAEILGKAQYTIREYCRKGQIKAQKTRNGRGWLICYEELQRIRNYGALREIVRPMGDPNERTGDEPRREQAGLFSEEMIIHTVVSCSSPSRVDAYDSISPG